ncbi:MAG: Fe-S cluster assembly ATPase SufC [Euryarchaeota archaeon]|jgi:Fe-S cluster assembly ATP-binding protein|nr:Fe-S cluster assembly ATPase SufC [Euryarchaeota archaeon]MBT3970896.1 Fe-S cluster assembly ATPase SufC [Euryarchaeota archaeon]MBT4407314.1 Fe-S cluster assembly ATPase SufC [Euryarchaeota archaeon]MBT6644946.1 Fe-S cluster assembly ATPase SufC [Euryarchaeota archaeon]
MPETLLLISDLHVSVDGTPIIKGLSLEIMAGEVHAIMGRNGAGKSTLAYVLMGHPAYEITSGEIYYLGIPLAELEVHQRAKLGMFLSFQYPQAIPGVQVGTFLRKSVQAIRGENAPSAREFRVELNESLKKLGVEKSFLPRYVNDGFSGGEKKRLEILQMLLLKPQLAILDETDSGLDVDALRTVAEGINEIAKTAGCLIITHYQRLLNHVNPDYIHIMIDGKIVKTGEADLALVIEEKGYDWLEV